MRFPSPYGVSFILIYRKSMKDFQLKAFVSVSLRSIIHSYYQDYLYEQLMLEF